MSFYIKDGYISRWPVVPFNPFGADEAYQRPVYERARQLFRTVSGQLLVDLGCGTGAKLAEFFLPHEAVGIDTPEVIRQAIRETEEPFLFYANDSLPALEPCDVLLCADVIEHVEDPEAFLSDALATYRPRWVVLSTPARDYIKGGSLNGPPVNRSHAREWTMDEFFAFCSDFLTITEHTLIDHARATQCVVGRVL